MSPPPSDALALPAPRRVPRPFRAAGPAVAGALATAYLSLIVLIPLAAVVVHSLDGGVSGFWDAISGRAGLGSIKFTLWVSARGRRHQRRHRDDHRLGARARRVPRQALRQRDHRPPLRAADDRRRPDAARPLRSEGSRRDRRRLHAGGRAAGAALRHAALRGALRAARAAGARPRDGGRGGVPGRAPLTVFRRIILPNLGPAILSGVGLGFARALGEFGSIVLISGNLPFKTEVASVFVFGQIESDRVTTAAAVSVCCS